VQRAENLHVIMEDLYLKYYRELKLEVEKTYKKTYPSCALPIEEWKGQQIVNLQEELISRAGGSISEKWFYTHIKGGTGKVPRTDMLEILSKYCGYRGWEDFISKKSDNSQEFQEMHLAEKGKKSRKKIHFLALALTLSVLLILGIFFIFIPSEKVIPEYVFCFIDADNKKPVRDSLIEINIIKEGESGFYKNCDKNGCFSLSTEAEKITFIVKAPYYKTDTVVRVLSGNGGSEKIKLHTDDYALMIHIFSTSKIEDWKRRRAQLDEMIADNAKIIQVSSDYDNHSMELYNKSGFINKMTIPAKSLKNIRVIETVYEKGKISVLRFMQMSE